MSLDSLLSSLGAAERNLGAHSLVLLHSQQVSSLPGASSAATGATRAGPGGGGAVALLRAAWTRLSLPPRRVAGVMMLSLERPGSAWMHPLPPAAAAATGGESTPRLVLDACSHRFATQSSTAASASSSTPVAVSSLPATSLQTLHTHEIKSLQRMRDIIESAAKQMHAQYSASPAASSPTAPSPPLSSPDPAAAFGVDDNSRDSFPVDCVALLIDDLHSLFARFGPSRSLAFLRSLQQSHAARLLIVDALDLDGLASLANASPTSLTETAAVDPVALQRELDSRAAAVVSVRSVQQTHSSAAGEEAAAGSSSLLLALHTRHTRPSGKRSEGVEEAELRLSDGRVRKIARARLDAASTAASASAAAAGSQAKPGAAQSLAAQFGSSFSLDLSSHAASARAQVALPYTSARMLGGDSVESAAAGADEEDLLEEDEDEDFDDPDDDLDV